MGHLHLAKADDPQAPAFVELAHRHTHLLAFAETAESLHRRLTGRWVKLKPIPTYPALR